MMKVAKDKVTKDIEEGGGVGKSEERREKKRGKPENRKLTNRRRV